MSVLILRLAGPMQSWGTQSRFSVRDTGLEPSKSGVIGLLCAALGFPRDAEELDRNDFTIRFVDLTALKMAVRVDREGTLRRDYHTAGGGKIPVLKRYGVAKANQGTPGTVTSNRYYLADADFRVALESDDDDLLRLLESALRVPHWPIFLGRKAFVPSCPVLVNQTDFGSLRLDLSRLEALQNERWFFRNARERKQMQDDPRLRVVNEADSPVDEGEVRPDVPLSFATREFTIRHVNTSFMQFPIDLIEEDPACISLASL